MRSSTTFRHVASPVPSIPREYHCRPATPPAHPLQAARQALQQEIQTSATRVHRPCERTVYDARDRLQVVALKAAVTGSHLQRMLDALPEPPARTEQGQGS